MNAFLLYTLQASMLSLLFYTMYFLVLRKLTFFKWNRCYLLVSLTLSILIPLIPLQAGLAANNPVGNFIPSWKIYSTLAGEDASNTGNYAFNWIDVVGIVYRVGAVFILAKFAVSLVLISKLYRKKSLQKLGEIRIVEGAGRITNCSFLDTIFVNPDDLTAEAYAQIVEHEQCHVLLKHTYDKLYLHLIRVLLWYNPFIYLFRRSLEEVHEFEADALLTRKTDKEKYVNFLLNISTNHQLELLHYFSKKPLKARILMLFAERSRHFKKMAYVFSIPVFAFGLLAFSKVSPDISERMTVQGTAEQLPSEPSTQDPSTVFFSRKTMKNKDGIAFDEVRMNFNNYHIVGHVPTGGKVLYKILDKKYEEDEIKKFTQDQIKQIKCPCSVRIIETGKDPLIDGVYDGVVQLSRK
ncbi:MAG TPA: hypothetical protein VD993_00405 [Chitinophagaceae bacterium]|nr:hypothetical protein [Chitinophagaceae bacterium]